MTFITHYPTLVRLLISLLIFVNLLCGEDAYALIDAALKQCHARTSNHLQQKLQRLLFLPTMLTSLFPVLLCTVGQILAALLLSAGDLPMAALFASLPLLAFVVHLLVLAGGCLVLGLLE